MVGPGLHRVDQRGARPAALPRAPAADPAGRPRLLRPAGARDPPRAGRTRARATASRRSSTGTTGSAAATASSSVRSARCSAAASPTSASPRVGEPVVDRHLARRPGPRAEAADLPRARGRRGALRDAAARVPRRALLPGERQARCSTSSGPRSCRMPPHSSIGGRAWRAQAGLDGLYLVAEMSDLLGRGARYTDRGCRRIRRRACTCGCPSRSTRWTTAAACGPRRKLHGRSRDLAVLRHDRRHLPARPPTSSRACTRTGTTRPEPVDGGLAVTGATPEQFQRNVEPAVALLADRPPRSACSGSSRGTSGPRATTSSPTCETAMAGSRRCSGRDLPA